MMRDALDAGRGGSCAAGDGGAGESELAECASLALSQEAPPYSGDYIVADYMDRLGTRLNILETELKYAWRALDLLSQEYVRMWERLERLESLLADQQGVISTLLDFYSCRTITGAQDPMARLGVIREILGNGGVEDGIEEALEVSGGFDANRDEAFESDEAFYRSLNSAYRDDLVIEEGSRPSSQLDMIWEAPEDPDASTVYSATDYKDYRGDSPCISDADLAKLSTLSAIDQATLDKLHELDRLSNQLTKDSRELKDLKTRLLSPEKKSVSVVRHDRDIEAKTLVEDGNIINEQLRHVYAGAENWSLNDPMKTFDEMMLSMPKEVSTQLNTERSPSRLSLSEPSEKSTEYLPSHSLSPRRILITEKTSTEPYSTVTGRLAYSSAVANQELKLSKSPSALSRDRFDYSYQMQDASTSGYNKYLSTLSTSQQMLDIFKSNPRPHSPALSLHSMFNEQYSNDQDSLMNMDYAENRLPQSPSPPPPAPPNGAQLFAVIDNNNQSCINRTSLLPTASPLPTDQMRLSPRSPRSPRTSPKYAKRDSSNIVAAKSDSGLSSMSGWSSLEKSPGSPKTSKHYNAHDMYKMRIPSPQNLHKLNSELDSKPYLETLVDSYRNTGSKTETEHHFHKPEYVDKELSNTRKVSEFQNSNNPFIKNDGSYTTPEVSTISQSLFMISEYSQRNEPPAIYSVAGNRQPNFTSVCSVSRVRDKNYPDIIDVQEHTENPRIPIESYPPEPSYHAQTLLFTSTTTSAPTRRNLTRASSIGATAMDFNYYQNGHKSNSHRKMYPPSNITDALSYYPTSARYDPPTVKHTSQECNDPLSWQDSTRSPSSSIDTASMNSQYVNSERVYQNQLQQEYFRQQQYDQRNDNRVYENVLMDSARPSDYNQYRNDQYVQSSGILVSQSGYVSISSNLNGRANEKTKKTRRTSSLKSAMTSMSQWLPDLHLPKKHRSFSLPSGVDDVEETGQSHDNNREKTLKERVLSAAQRRKKKYHLVASMSGLLLKARRKHHTSHTSLSDPDTSETEWSGGRSSALSEDSDSVFSDSNETNMFAKVITNTKPRKLNHQEVVEQQQKIQELQQQGDLFPQIGDQLESQEGIDQTIISIPRDKSDDIDYHFAILSKKVSSDGIADIQKLDIDTDISEVGPYEEDGNKSSGSHSGSSIFATIGDVKRQAITSDDSSLDGKSYSGGGPMEFAVSRALGKYRLRKSSSVSDEQVSETSPPKSENEDEKQFEPPPTKENKSQKPSPPEIISSTLSEEPTSVASSSPSGQSVRSHHNKLMPRHQQSLEIPTGRHDDDDNRSTHSWRSGSRVSSRRQSTEDSIDSEDEWYCYELRKLEEMEYQSQLEAEREQKHPEVPELEPEEALKEKMTYVLRELKLKTANTKKNYDDAPIRDSLPADRFASPETRHESDKVEDTKRDVECSDEEHSSGETSGPDSPVQSGDELEDDYDKPKVYTEPQKTEKPPTQDAPTSSKWKLLKALKDRKAEEKSTVESPAETTAPSTEKDKVSASVNYIMQKLYEIRVKS